MNRMWTKQELDFLQDKWGVLSIPKIAEKLNRSVYAVKLKACRMHLGAFIDNSNYVSLRSVIIGAFKSDYMDTFKIWEQRGIPVHYKRINAKSIRTINLDEFWDWAKNNVEIIRFERLDRNALGKEPEWVDEVRKSKYKSIVCNGEWTNNDDTVLQRMALSGRYSIDELAKRFARSEAAVYRRLYDLCLDGTLLKRNTPKQWADDEIEQMLLCRANGMSFERIGELLGRSAYSCRGKYQSLCNPHSGKEKSEYFSISNCNTAKELLEQFIERKTND